MSTTLQNAASNIAASIVGHRNTPQMRTFFNTMDRDCGLKWNITVTAGGPRMECSKLIKCCRGESFDSLRQKVVRSFRAQAKDLFYSDASFEVDYQIIPIDEMPKPVKIPKSNGVDRAAKK